jgi:DNA-binding response OmpR family regulator
VARILVVDDDPSIRRLLTAILRSEEPEHDVVVAEDGEDAVAMLADEDRPVPDAVVLDVMMPGLDGFEVLAWIRATEWLYDLPVVMLTARTALEDEVAGFHRGCDAYVRKPFEPTELVEVLEGVLRAGPELRIARRRQRLVELLQGGRDSTGPVELPEEGATAHA